MYVHVLDLWYMHGLCVTHCRECSPESCPCCGPQTAVTKTEKEGKKAEEQPQEQQQQQQEWCGNTVIQRRQFPPLEVFESAACGFGLRCPQALPPCSIVAEYTGDVLTEEECLTRMSTYKSTDAFYFASLGKGLILDAGKMGSVARFANHHCAPNCALQKWCVNGEPRVVLITLDAPIPPNTELCYNYHYCEDGLEMEESQRQPCHCGAPCCAGTIGGKVTAAVASAATKWIEKVKALLLLITLSPLETALVCEPGPRHCDSNGNGNCASGCSGGRSDQEQEQEHMHLLQDYHATHAATRAGGCADSAMKTPKKVTIQQIRDLLETVTAYEGEEEEEEGEEKEEEE